MTESFGPLARLRETPVDPEAETHITRAIYRATPIERTDPRASEPLVDATDYGVEGRNHYAHAHNAPYYAPAPGAIDRILVRRGVAERLARVNSRLAEAGLALFVYDGWRPNDVQRYFYEVWTPRALRTRDPTLEGAALEAAVSRYWAAPTTDESAPAPHATGGAVDLTLRWRDGEPLWMGTLFDDPCPASHPRAFETPAQGVSFTHEEARANRRLLYWLMREADFAINPTEWWHFSHGDQMWARLTNATAAFYGATTP